MAAAIFKKLADNKHESFSAGTEVRREREGQKLKDKMPADDPVLVALREMGIDASEQTRHHLTPEMLAEADMAIVMAEPETIPEFLAKSDKAIRWNVKDTDGLSLPDVRETRDHLVKLITELLKKIK